MNTDSQVRLAGSHAGSQGDCDGKFAWVQTQICRVALGYIDSIACPYCGSDVTLGVEKLCCEPLGEATAAVLYRMESGCEAGGGLAGCPEPQSVAGPVGAAMTLEGNISVN